MSGIPVVAESSPADAGTRTCEVVETNRTLASGTYEFACLVVEAGATLTVEGDPLNDTPGSIIIVEGDIVVNGTISANGQGHPSGSGPGAGETTSDESPSPGGSHGGRGGEGDTGESALTYGNLYEPLSPGSGGGGSNGGDDPGGHGGGVVRLEAEAGSLHLNGRITADGDDAEGCHCGQGGGAGGSILIETGRLVTDADAVIQAHGGNGSEGGGGGGGRVAIYYSNRTGSIVPLVDGGEAAIAARTGEAGTAVLLKRAGGITIHNESPRTGQPVAVSARINDPDGDAIADYEWTFGDGGTAVGANATHVYSTNGTYTITLAVTDLANVTSTVQKSITVDPGETPPALVDGAPPTDIDGDGIFEDLNGNGRLEFDDVVQYFRHIQDDSIKNHASAYDYNANGRIDFADIVVLFSDV